MRTSIKVNTIFNVLNKLTNMLFPLITSVYLSNTLGPVYIGKISYAQSILSYFTIVASLGIPVYGMREIAKAGSNQKSRNKSFSELFLLNFVSSAVCSFIYIAAVSHLPIFHQERRILYYLGLSLYFNVFNVDWFYSGREEYVYLTIKSILIKLASLAVVFLTIHSEQHYLRYALLLGLTSVVNCICDLIYLRGKVKIQIHHLEIRKHLKPVFILLMTMLATDLYNQVDITMLGVMRTDAEVGCYSNGIKLIRIVISLLTTGSATILPRMCAYYEKKEIHEFNTVFLKTLDIIFLISMPSAVGLWIIADPLVLMLFGNAFILTVPVIRILSFLIIIIPISYLIGSVVLTATGHEKYLLVATLSGAAVNIAFNLIFIRIKGINGAAVASVLAESVVLAIHAFYGHKFVFLKINKGFIKSVILSTAIMGLSIFELSRLINSYFINVSCSVCAGIIVYALMLAITKNTVVKEILKELKDDIKRKIHRGNNTNLE